MAPYRGKTFHLYLGTFAEKPSQQTTGIEVGRSANKTIPKTQPNVAAIVKENKVETPCLSLSCSSPSASVERKFQLKITKK